MQRPRRLASISSSFHFIDAVKVGVFIGLQADIQRRPPIYAPRSKSFAGRGGALLCLLDWTIAVEVYNVHIGYYVQAEIMRTVTSVDAQNRFGELLDNAQREPVTITRRGRPVAFILSPADMKDLLAIRRQRERVVSDFEAFFAAADACVKPEALALSDSDVQRMVNELR